MNDTKVTPHNVQESRRAFLKASATLAGAAGVFGVAGVSDVLGSSTGPMKKSGKLHIKIAGYAYDRAEALVNGRVQVEGCETQFEIAPIGDMNSDVFSGAQTRAVTKIGLHPFMLAYANEGFRDYSLLPIFPLRVFRHKSIFIRADSGINRPEDLSGKKVATPGFSSTSLTWLRGILQHEYGVKQEEIEWVVASQDSSADAVGQTSKFESIVPKGISVSKGPAGKDESDLLESGDVDALFHAAEPRGYVEGNPKIARLFNDYRMTEQAYFKKTGIFPIMHAVAIRNDVLKANPWLPESVFNAYSEAKKMMYGNLRKMGWAYISLPWIGQEVEETIKLMGDNYWPYGIAPNRKTLETLFQYSYEQKLAAKRLKIEDLFHPSTLELSEN